MVFVNTTKKYRKQFFYLSRWHTTIIFKLLKHVEHEDSYLFKWFYTNQWGNKINLHYWEKNMYSFELIQSSRLFLISLLYKRKHVFCRPASGTGPDESLRCWDDYSLVLPFSLCPLPCLPRYRNDTPSKMKMLSLCFWNTNLLMLLLAVDLHLNSLLQLPSTFLHPENFTLLLKYDELSSFSPLWNFLSDLF